MNEESLRDIALELLKIVEDLAEASIYEYDGYLDLDEALRKIKEDMAEYKRRIDNAK